jgi:hypothetical protein
MTPKKITWRKEKTLRKKSRRRSRKKEDLKLLMTLTLLQIVPHLHFNNPSDGQEEDTTGAQEADMIPSPTTQKRRRNPIPPNVKHLIHPSPQTTSLNLQ